MTSVLLSAIRELGNAYRKMNDNKSFDQKLRKRVSALETQVISELQKIAAASNATPKSTLIHHVETSVITDITGKTIVSDCARSHIVDVKRAYSEINRHSSHASDGVAAGSRLVSHMPPRLAVHAVPSSLKDCRQPFTEIPRPALYKEQFCFDDNLRNNIPQSYDGPKWFTVPQNNSSYELRNQDFVQYHLPNVPTAHHEIHNPIIEETHRPLMAVASVSGMMSRKPSFDLSSSESNNHHRPLDRSVSEPLQKSNASSFEKPALIIDPGRYKTELCRAFEENGTCPYNRKCQFAHGLGELRVVPRNPRYKTEFCRAFHSTGICPYGRRCLFIHNDYYRSRINSGNLPSGADNSSHEQDFCGQSIGSAGELSPGACSVSTSPTFPTVFMEDPFKASDSVSVSSLCTSPAANNALRISHQKSPAPIPTQQVPYRWDECGHDSSVVDPHPVLLPVSQPLINQASYVQQPMPSCPRNVQQPMPSGPRNVQQPMPPDPRNVPQPMPPGPRNVPQPMPPGPRNVHQLDVVNRQIKETNLGLPAPGLQKPTNVDMTITESKTVSHSQNIARLPVFTKICNQQN